MPSLTIEYGRKGGPRSGHIREGRRGVPDPAFTVRPRETPPLRLNTDHGVRFPPEQLSQLPGNAEKLAYLRQEIAGALDLFAPYQRAFLDAYFAFITDQCQSAARALAERVNWSHGLFRADDFVFSALWPLPNARVILFGDGGHEQDFGDYDFVFWDGRRAIAVTIAGRAPSAGSAASRKTGAFEALLPATIVASELNERPGPFTEPRFSSGFVSFWEGDPAPSSPFRPDGLALPADAIV